MKAFLRMVFSKASLLAVFLLGMTPAIRADVAPPLTPPASSIWAEPGTRVQMWSETVELDARGLVEDSGTVSVTARFRMRDSGSSPEQLRVRFPLEHPMGIGDAYGGFPAVQDLAVYVDSQPVVTAETREPTYSTYWGEVGPEIRWATFGVAFPVGRDVTIDVAYTIQPTPDYDGTRLDYVMETGAGWWGAIERAEIVVRLPYPSSTIRGSFRQADTWPAPRFAGDSLRWVRWHVEPATDDNFYLLLAPPHLWVQVLTLERRIRNGEGTSADYVALTEAYWYAATDRHDWVFFPGLAIAAQASATRGLIQFPGTPDLMGQEAYMQIMWIATHTGTWTLLDLSPSEQAQVARARCEIARALELDPSSTWPQMAAEAFRVSTPREECPPSSRP
jgi:hypothetical protein